MPSKLGASTLSPRVIRLRLGVKVRHHFGRHGGTAPAAYEPLARIATCRRHDAVRLVVVPDEGAEVRFHRASVGGGDESAES